MKNSLFVLFFVLMSSGCLTETAGEKKRLADQERVDQEEARRSTTDHLRRVSQEVQYFKDPRTNLCFAYIWEGHGEGYEYGYGGPGLAHVPCTPEVEAQILRLTTAQ